MSLVAIIGGGAAGLMAAVAASEKGHEVIIFEQNEKLGKKIYITGKGRCNFTNACDLSDFFDNIVTNDKFLYSAIYQFTNDQTMDFFTDNGTSIKVERGNRAFPESDHASSITKTFERYLAKQNVKVCLNSKVTKIETKNDKVVGIRLEDGGFIETSHVIVATGGKSYETTGSRGDGYRFAKALGHKIVPPSPALVPLVTKEDYITKLQGLSLRNVNLTLYSGKKKVFEQFGEMLFTHFGVSGPLVLSASSYIGKMLDKEVIAKVDLKPALSSDKLRDRIIREINNNQNKEIKFLLSGLLPSKMVDVFVELLGVDEHLKLCEFTKVKRDLLIKLLKEFTFTITGKRGFNEAIITQGGVDVRNVNPSTMESKLIKGLYFAGEVLDIDALTGGFNMQLAFSTGHLAGESIEEE